MKPLTKQKYIATWYINVGNVPPGDVPSYMEAAKKSLGGGLDDPWYELKAFLEAAVHGYFIPVRTGETRLELQEVEVRIEDYDEETS